MLSRRGFLGGLFAAPVIVRASSLMSIKPFEEEFLTSPYYYYDFPSNGLLTPNMIAKEAIRLWRKSNQFLENF